jgi:hypothetical protein
VVGDNEIAHFERAVLAQGPRGAVVVGVSLSPDGRYGAALTLLPSAGNYWMDDVFIRVGDGWKIHGGGNGGLCWSSLGEDGKTGVLRYGDEAPAGAISALIDYEGEQQLVPVRHGHFLYVAWDTAYREDPRVIRFE